MRIGVIIILGLGLCSCGAVPDNSAKSAVELTANSAEDTAYEIVVLDAQFDRYLQTRAQVRGYHSQSYLEQRNRQALPDYNRLVRNRPNWSAQEIHLELGVDYGYEVHYILFNYLQYLSDSHRIRLGSFVPGR